MRDKKLWRAFQKHRVNAKFRNIEFLLSYVEWLKIWVDSGHLPERGKDKCQYVMARLGDSGAYVTGNVKIITGSENSREHRHTLETRTQIGNSGRGQKRTKKTRANIKRAAKKAWASAELRSRHSKLLAEVCSVPEIRAQRSSTTKRCWEDPKYRAEREASAALQWADPVAIAEASRAALLRWASPDYRAKQAAAVERRRKLKQGEEPCPGL